MFRDLLCRPYVALLARWCENPALLSAAERTRIESHLARCAACRAQADATRRASAILRARKPAAAQPSADLWERLQAQIQADAPPASPSVLRQEIPAQRPAPSPAGLRWNAVVPVAALAACVIVAVGMRVGLFDGATGAGSGPRQFGAITHTPFYGYDNAPQPEVVVTPRQHRIDAGRREAVNALKRRRESQDALALARQQARAALSGGAASEQPGRTDPFGSLHPTPAATPVVSVARAVVSVPSAGRTIPLAAEKTPAGDANGAAQAGALGGASLELPSAKPPHLARVALAERRKGTGEAGSGLPAASTTPEAVLSEGSAGRSAAADTVEKPMTSEAEHTLEIARHPGGADSSLALNGEKAANSLGSGVSARTGGSEPFSAPTEAVTVQKRQRSLFNYGGAVGESTGGPTPRR